MLRILFLALALATGASSAAQAQAVQVVTSCSASGINAPLGSGYKLTVDVNGNLCTSGGGGSSSGNSAANPSYTTPAGIARMRYACTLPAYATGGNAVCTDSAGNQVTNACAANAACLISAPNANRKTAFFMNRTAGTTIDVGYAATVAPGNGVGVDGPGTSGGQGGSLEENPAHVGAYYAASPAASTLVFVQGQ